MGVWCARGLLFFSSQNKRCSLRSLFFPPPLFRQEVLQLKLDSLKVTKPLCLDLPLPPPPPSAHNILLITHTCGVHSAGVSDFVELPHLYCTYFESPKKRRTRFSLFFFSRTLYRTNTEVYLQKYLSGVPGLSTRRFPLFFYLYRNVANSAVGNGGVPGWRGLCLCYIHPISHSSCRCL